MSLNSCLAKGPDSYKTNLLGVLLRFWEDFVVLVGDIRKMYNSVHLEILEQHTHRFLWRDLEDKFPEEWCITRVNMGDEPAGAIAVEAKDMTASLFKELNPRAASLIVDSFYVDDLVDSVPSIEEARRLASGVEEILAKGGFFLKDWKFGGIDVEQSLESFQVLGLWWSPETDTIFFRPCFNFSPKKRGARTLPNLLASEVPDGLPAVMTRRLVLEQVMGVYDPLGLLSPFLLLAKILLRESWTGDLGWDDPLPSAMTMRWRHFFEELVKVASLSFPRCLRPRGLVGHPELIILSDGSEVAYGCAAYIRWELNDGQFWSRLILSKCRIAPVRRISVPQMELNGAVLSKRVRSVIEKESRFQFERVLHLIDSETVLNMIHKVSTLFKVYEGVRVGEIQSATNGDLSCWGWVPGKLNIADWVTRHHSPCELGPESEWYSGPEFLQKPFVEWKVKFLPTDADASEPRQKIVDNVASFRVDISVVEGSLERCSNITTVRWALARVIGALRSRTFGGGKRQYITPELLRDADSVMAKECRLHSGAVCKNNSAR